MLLALSTLYARKLLSLLRIAVLYHAAKAVKRPSRGIFSTLISDRRRSPSVRLLSAANGSRDPLLSSRLSRRQMLRRALRRCAAGNRYRQLLGNRIRHARLHEIV